MGHKYNFVESTCVVKFGNWTVTVWRKESETKENYGQTDIVNLVSRESGWHSGQEIAEAVAALPRVTVVEVVLDLHGDNQYGLLKTGIVIYNIG